MLLISMFSINNTVDIYSLGVLYELTKICRKNSEIIIKSEKLLKCESIDTIKQMIGFYESLSNPSHESFN